MNSYTFHINLYDLAFLGAIFIGFNFALLLYFAKTVNRGANRFLAMALVTIIVWMTRILAIDLRLETYWPGWDKLPMQFLLALGPLIYFYVLKITRPKYTLTWRDLLHFAPLLLEQAVFALEIKESIGNGTATYTTHVYQQLNPVLQLFIFISLISYLRVCDKLIQIFYRRLQPVLMDRPLLEFRWLRRLLGATALLSLLWIFCASVDYFGYRSQLGIQVYYTFYIFFIVIIIWTAAAAFLRPQAAVMAQPPAPLKPPVPVELRAKGVWLKRAMEANLYYQDPELSLSSLAEKLSIPPHELSKLINTVFKKGFNDFVNEYRIRDVVFKMQNPAYDNITLLGIAYEAGFNSKRTFNRVFKEMTGKTPVEFKNDLKNEGPNDKLAPLPRIRPVILRSESPPNWAHEKLNSNNMFRNYLKLALRNISRHKGFSAINIAGLTLGLTACILIGFFVWDEYQYDKSIPGGSLVYRIYNDYKNSDGESEVAVTPPMFAIVLNNDFPEAEEATRVLSSPEFKTLFEAGKNNLYEQSGYFVDSTYFKVFPLSFKYGTPAGALNSAASIVLSDDMSQRLFGDGNPVGKQILMDKQPLLVKGVFIKDPKFHLQFNYLRSLAGRNIPREDMQSWGWEQFFTYVKLKNGADVHALQTKFQNEVKLQSASLKKESNITYKPFLQPLKDIHLHSANFKFDAAKRGNITYVNAMVVIAIFILAIACFNFVNLATAKSLQRAKEVGVRKALGATKHQLVLQFIGETILFAFISLVIAVMLAMLFLPWLNNFTGKNISISFFTSAPAIASFVALMLATGVVAGFYPALVMTKFNPVKVLKGSMPGNEQTGKIPWLRHGLVVIQFALSVLLIISAIVVYKQVDYLHVKDLGFNKDQIMFFPVRGDNMSKNTDAFKTGLLAVPGVSSVSIGYGFPGDAVAGDEIIVPRNGQRVSQSATQLMGDYDYIKTLGLQIVTGRDFSKSMATDKDHAWIINETAVKTLGFGTPEKALGQTLYWHAWDAPNPDSLKAGQVIGVVKDFNYKSLYEKVETTVLQIYPFAAWKVAVKLKAANIGNAINGVRNVWGKFSPEYPLEYKFLDENFGQMYNAEDRLSLLLGIFTAIAIFIGCLGLFGLAAYTAERRKKEVGIRKVLGASTQGIVLLLSKDFVKLVIVALLVASPVGWYFMNKWLEHFAYRINIAWWIFAIAAAVAIGIALITVSFQAVKAALANPVKSLRSE